MKKSLWVRLLTAVLCVGWGLLFLRGETTEKSMMRFLYAGRTRQGSEVILWYQAPEAAADAADASGALQCVQAEGATLELALAQAQRMLPQTADYRLCDYLLVPQQDAARLLSEYEQLVLELACGRTAARVCCTELSGEMLRQLCSGQERFADKLLEKLQQHSGQMPRLYQHRESLLLPLLECTENGAGFAEEMLLQTAEEQRVLPPNEAQMALLLCTAPGTRTFWLDGQQLELRRCSVSVAMEGAQALLRLDAQPEAGTPQPTAAQSAALARLAEQAVETFWQQGTDWLSLRARTMLQDSAGGESWTTKNACPKIRADVRFVRF